MEEHPAKINKIKVIMDEIDKAQGEIAKADAEEELCKIRIDREERRGDPDKIKVAKENYVKAKQEFKNAVTNITTLKEKLRKILEDYVETVEDYVETVKDYVEDTTEKLSKMLEGNPFTEHLSRNLSGGGRKRTKKAKRKSRGYSRRK
jgi:hypothetical protein